MSQQNYRIIGKTAAQYEWLVAITYVFLNGSLRPAEFYFIKS